jgi:hypothetical protein
VHSPKKHISTVTPQLIVSASESQLFIQAKSRRFILSSVSIDKAVRDSLDTKVTSELDREFTSRLLTFHWWGREVDRDMLVSIHAYASQLTLSSAARVRQARPE